MHGNTCVDTNHVQLDNVHAPLALSFSMFNGLGQNSNLALKLERSHHREHVY